MKVDGACHCGAIAYEAEVDPAALTLCHCSDCQTFSGAPYRGTITCAPGTFRLLRGAPKIYVKTAESGRKRRQGFCPNCGTSIYSAADEENPQTFGLRMGPIRQKAQLTTHRQVWRRSALPWSGDITKVPALDTQ